MPKLDNTQIVRILINEMFKISGHDVTYDQLLDRKDEWYNQYTMTEQQNQEWKKFGVKLLMKEKRMLKKKAEYEMGMLDLNWGLKIESK